MAPMGKEGASNYEGKWALVTGAGRKGRVGETIAKRLAAKGANIYLHYRPGGDAEAVEVKRGVEEAGAAFRIEVVLVAADLTQESDITRTFTNIRPDIVIHNAAVFEPARVAPDASLEDAVAEHTRVFEKNINANLYAVQVSTEAAIHEMRKQKRTGTFVFVGDAFIEHGGVYGDGLAAYTASKAAVEKLVAYFQTNYGAAGFRFFAVLNGPIEPPPSAPEESVEEIADELPVPEEEKDPWLGADRVADAIIAGIDGKLTGVIDADGGRRWTTAREH